VQETRSNRRTDPSDDPCRRNGSLDRLEPKQDHPLITSYTTTADSTDHMRRAVNASLNQATWARRPRTCPVQTPLPGPRIAVLDSGWSEGGVEPVTQVA
jgi:hypothetical protein